jgi:hypothetical protein
MGLRQGAERTAYKEESGDVPSSEVSRRTVRARKRERAETVPYTNCFSDVFAPMPMA